jgi:multidrug efflux pump subunit AcrA (membrane-fusion protein)
MNGHDLERHIGATIRNGIVVILLAAAALTGWAALAPISGAVIAPAFVKVDLNRKVVQHQEGGIVQQVHVRDGDRVAVGDVLLTLQDVQVDATVEVLTLQLDAERAKAARLEGTR